MQESYIERILKARVYDVAIESPLEPARRLSRRLRAPRCRRDLTGWPAWWATPPSARITRGGC